MKLKILLYAFLLLMTAAVQAGNQPASSDSAGSTRSLSSDGASVRISNLEDGDVVPTIFTVKFDISGMGIAPAGTNIDNTGHHHLLIDVAELPDFDQPIPATATIIHFGKGQTETELNLAAGDHTLQLLLADYAHIPHDPPVYSKKITVRVSPDAPAQSKENRE